MRTRQLRQTVSIKAPVRAVYGALVNSRQHSRITGARARIGAKVGSAFSVWDGGVSGFTLALEPNRRIVLAWRSADWPAGHHSIVTFAFRKAGAATRLVLQQYGIPAGAYRDIAQGWKTYYWQPMKNVLEG